MLELAPVSYLDGLLEADSFEEVASGDPEDRAEPAEAAGRFQRLTDAKGRRTAGSLRGLQSRSFPLWGGIVPACEWCGGTFWPESSRQRFCGSKCRYALRDRSGTLSAVLGSTRNASGAAASSSTSRAPSHASIALRAARCDARPPSNSRNPLCLPQARRLASPCFSRRSGVGTPRCDDRRFRLGRFDYTPRRFGVNAAHNFRPSFAARTCATSRSFETGPGSPTSAGAT